MQRRHFFRWMAGAGLCATSAALLRGAYADESGGALPAAAGAYAGPLWVTLEAHGGWDTTWVCDPHANLNRSYDASGIGSAGALRYPNVGTVIPGFFQDFADRLMVINGIDQSTVVHRAGQYNTWTGHLDETHPVLAALVAGSYAPQLPLSFVGEGVRNMTEGLVAETRVDNSDVLQELSFPNVVNPGADEDMRLDYHPEPATEMIASWRQDRMKAMASKQNLPRIAHAMDNLDMVRAEESELALLQSYLPETLNADPVRRKIEIIVAAYKAGLAVSANLRVNAPGDNFDTHNSNDARQRAQMEYYLGVARFLWNEMDRQLGEEGGAAQNLVAMMGSDFARQSNSVDGYNARAGKDHWSVTSMMVMGAGIPGNRVVGATDERQNAMRVDPNTLELSNDGITLGPKHVHRALRNLAGVSAEIDARFPLDTEELPLFA
jgi:hypothetical protein